MFLEHNNQFVFETRKECIKYEKEYEKFNLFPQLVKKNLEGKSWWKLDRSFGVPAIYAGLKFDTAVDMKSLQQETLLKVFNEYLNDVL
jgi:insulysin